MKFDARFSGKQVETRIRVEVQKSVLSSLRPIASIQHDTRLWESLQGPVDFEISIHVRDLALRELWLRLLRKGDLG